MVWLVSSGCFSHDIHQDPFVNGTFAASGASTLKGPDLNDVAYWRPKKEPGKQTNILKAYKRLLCSIYSSFPFFQMFCNVFNSFKYVRPHFQVLSFSMSLRTQNGAVPHWQMVFRFQVVIFYLPELQGTLGTRMIFSFDSSIFSNFSNFTPQKTSYWCVLRRECSGMIPATATHPVGICWVDGRKILWIL